MSGDHKRQLEQTPWNIADELRGKMHADEFRDYILGFIFYKHLSKKQCLHANGLLETETVKNCSDLTGPAGLEAIRDDSLETLGYFLEPNQLFDTIARKGNSKAENDEGAEAALNYILDELDGILTHIEQSTKGTESEEEEPIDLAAVSTELKALDAGMAETDAEIAAFCNELNIAPPF